MAKWGFQRSEWVLWGTGLAWGGLLLSGAWAYTLTPESPEVQEAIVKGIRFLESEASKDDRLGAQVLIGLVLLKHGASPDHPRIVQAVTVIQKIVQRASPRSLSLDIYSTGLAITFLVTLDSRRYRSEIMALLEYLESKQKSHGGWGYPDRPTGDTSMTQYAVLSCWEATQVGIKVPMEMLEGVAGWLLKTQDPGGGFGYQGKPAEGFEELVKQEGVSLSMTAAGLGSTYICAELLGLVRPVREDPILPPALKKVTEASRDRETRKTSIKLKLVRDVQARGNRWLRANYQIDPKPWTHYYLYALERYWSFREAAEDRTDPELKWYNDGARYLLRTQSPSGSWKSNAGETPDTAFGLLFLLRSMKKSIERNRSYGSGTLVGGRGLPKDTSTVLIRQGKVVASAELHAMEQVLDAIGDPDEPEFSQAVATLAELPPETGRALLSSHARKLKELAGGSSPEARIAAIRALAKTGDFDAVPMLIDTLGDPDLAVMREARAALERLSRKFRGYGPSDSPSDDDRRKAIEAWKAWFLTIQPDAKFEE